MRTRKGIPIVLAMAVTVIVAAQASAVSVTMLFDRNEGQTRIFKGDLSGLGLAAVTSATLTDNGSGGGSNGVFSGFDLDFLLLDADGDWSTSGDRVLPFQTAATSVTPGSIRSPSTYIPTPSHPGPLFGLLNDVAHSIDFANATIATRNAAYDDRLDFFSVDGSNGWVTLGDNGWLTAAFPQTVIGQGLWLFVGEAGIGTTEGVRASVDIAGPPVIPAPAAILLAGLGTLMIGCLRRRGIL